MTKITLSDISNPQNLTSLQTTINGNNQTLETASDNTISRDGTSPNQMLAQLDMNSNQIINLPAPGTVNSPARLIDVTSNPTITIPPTGTSGHFVPFLDGNNTWSGTEAFSAGITANSTAVFNGAVTFNGSVSGLSTVFPGWINTAAPKTTNYTVVTGDNGATFSLGGNSFYTLTFGAPGGYASNFVCMVTNADAFPGGRGKKMTISGFSNFILWPGQNIMVWRNGSTWDYHPKNQRWRLPAPVTMFVDTAGNDGNDGLASGAGALATMQQAATHIWYDMDLNGQGAIISPTAGQTFQQALALGGQPVGSNLVFIQGNGGPFTWQTPPGGGTMLSVGDNAEVSIQNINFVSSNNVFGQSALYLHNNGLCDLNTGISFTGGGTSDCAIFCDNNSCIFTVANGFTASNTFLSLIWMDGGGGATCSGVVGPSGSTSAANFCRLKGHARLTMGTAPAPVGWTSIGASIAEQQSILITNGVAIPGGTTTATGGLVV